MPDRGNYFPVQSQWGDAIAITPHASNPNKFNAFCVAAAGDATVVTPSGNTITFTGLLVGSVIPFPIALVTAATATLVGLT